MVIVRVFLSFSFLASAMTRPLSAAKMLARNFPFLLSFCRSWLRRVVFGTVLWSDFFFFSLGL